MTSLPVPPALAGGGGENQPRPVAEVLAELYGGLRQAQARAGRASAGCRLGVCH